VSDYVFEGDEIGAVRYLLKPVEKEKLAETMAVCLEKLKQKSDDYLSFKYQGEMIRLLRSDICYVEVYGHYLRMVTKTETYEWKDSLQSMRSKLDTRRNEMVSDKTAIFISHRMSSCRFCDEVVVFDEGEIVETGRHEELVADSHGVYHKMWKAQAQYYM